MLSYNVAALLRAAPGTKRVYPVQVADLPIAGDIELAAPITGEVRLSSTGRSILAHARLDTAVVEQCSRCLAPMMAPVTVEIEEEALPSIDLDSGLPVASEEPPDALRLDEHHELDLGGAVRDAISLAEPIAPLCRPDCRGLCLECGLELNERPDHLHVDDAIDPRLAALAGIRDRLEH